LKKCLSIIGVVIIILTTITLSGCQEEGATIEKNFEDIYFDSDVLELINASLDIGEKHGVIKKVEVTFYFKNLLDKDITYLRLAIEFCDINNFVLYNHSYEYLSGFPAGYIEKSPNRISYSEANVAYFDHVKINIDEYIIAD